MRADRSLHELAITLEIAFGREYPSNVVLRFGKNVVFERHADDSAKSGKRIRDVLRLPGERFRFEIHSDAVWQYEVELTGVADGAGMDASSRCVSGEGAMPHDYFGGNESFADFLMGSHSKSASVADHYREWADEVSANGNLYYDDFNLADINRRLWNIEEFEE